MKLRILNEKLTPISAEFMVGAKEEADYLRELLTEAKFLKVSVGQREAQRETNLYKVLVWKKDDGTADDIIKFLQNHPNIDYPKKNDQK